MSRFICWVSGLLRLMVLAVGFCCLMIRSRWYLYVRKLPELCFPLVIEAELEGLLYDVVVQPLHPRVGPQQLQALAVTLPKELPQSIRMVLSRPVLSSFSTHSREHDHLWNCQVLKVINFHSVLFSAMVRLPCTMLAKLAMLVDRHMLLYWKSPSLAGHTWPGCP